MATFLKLLLAFIWSTLVGFWVLYTYIDDETSLQNGLAILVGLFLVLISYISYGLITKKKILAVEKERHRKK